MFEMQLVLDFDVLFDNKILGIFFIVGSTNTSLFCSMRHIQYDIISPFCVISGKLGTTIPTIFN